jgi:hypothetical protein
MDESNCCEVSQDKITSRQVVFKHFSESIKHLLPLPHNSQATKISTLILINDVCFDVRIEISKNEVVSNLINKIGKLFCLKSSQLKFYIDGLHS